MDNNLKEKAEFWMSELFDQQTRDNVRFMMENHPDELYECFYQDLEFGTGGLRGKMGVGTNRVNQYTIGMASQGLANYVKKHTPKEDWRVAIAYDSRNRSREFAEATAQVFLGNDFEVYLFKDLRPTPELSFAIRHYKCTTGIVITASHNPPEYNGYKVYWKDGGQVVSPQDSGIIDEVRLVNGPGDILSASNLDGCNMIGEETDALFIENSKKQLLRTEMDKSLKLVYTNLHGTGGQLIPNALRDLGYQVTEVQEQILPNGDFPTVESPNPEEASAMKMATDLANEISADVIIGTDPDADRVGIGIRTETGEIELLNGNQTGSMLAHYVLTTLKEKNSLPANGFVAKTIVTSDLIKEIADAFKVPCYETLT
ncbi:MAG: phospho-sugar mutase, partial [Flavobacteriales bacterium]|nr:phospho-sugar mutase [Flavobacteriales bacterium]